VFCYVWYINVVVAVVEVEEFLETNLPFLVALLGFCAAFVVIVIVLIALAATACGGRRTARSARQVTVLMLRPIFCGQRFTFCITV